MKRILCLVIIGILVLNVAHFLTSRNTVRFRETHAYSAYPPPYPPPYLPSVLTPIPYPIPESKTKQSTTVATEKPVFVNFTIDVMVEGLENSDITEINLLPGNEKTRLALVNMEMTLPRQTVSNDAMKISVNNIPTGVYLLMISAPTNYFREPQGYLFGVSEKGVELTTD